MRYGRTYPARPIIKRLTLVILLSPSAPTLMAASVTDGSTTPSLSWTNNASPLTNTRVEVSSDGVTGWAEIANSPVASPGTSTTHAVGANSTTRYYRARAYDSSTGLFSGYSNVASVVTASAAPSALTVTAVNNSNNLLIAWADNSSDETGFGLERSNDGSSGWSEITAPAAAATSYTDTSVGARDTRRYYRIRAKRSGDGINSDYSSTANGYTAPADPSALALTPGSTTVTVAWTNNSATASEFRIERKTGSGGAYAEVGTDTASPYTDSSSIAENTEYYYKVRAYRASDGIYSGYCSELNVTTGPTAPSNLQGGCTVSVASASKVRIFWDSNTILENGFKLQRSTDNVTWADLATTAMGIQSYEDTGLAIDTTYYYRVSTIGFTAGSYSDYTTALQVKTTVGKVGDLFLAFQKKVRHFPSS